MELLNDIGNFLAGHWDLIGLSFTALGLSAALQKFKNKLQITNPKVLMAITSVLSFATAAVPALLGWLQANPEVLGQYTAFTFTLMTLIYRYVVQPTSSFLGDVKEYKQAKSAGVEGVSVNIAADVQPIKTIEKEAPVSKDFDL